MSTEADADREADKSQDTAERTNQALESEGSRKASHRLMQEVNQTRNEIVREFGSGNAQGLEAYEHYAAGTVTALEEEGILPVVTLASAEQTFQTLSQNDGFISAQDLQMAQRSGDAFNSALTSHLSQQFSYEFKMNPAIARDGISMQDLQKELSAQELAAHGLAPITDAKRAALTQYLHENPWFGQTFAPNGQFDRDFLIKARSQLKNYAPQDGDFTKFIETAQACDLIIGSYDILFPGNDQTSSTTDATAEAPAMHETYAHDATPEAPEVAEINSNIASLPREATLERGQVLYDIAQNTLSVRADFTGETIDHRSIMQECNRIMTLNGYPPIDAQGRIPNAWNNVRNGQTFKLYSDEDILRFNALAAQSTQGNEGSPSYYGNGDVDGDGEQYGGAPPYEGSSPEENEQLQYDTPAQPQFWDPELNAVNASLEHPQGLKPGDKYWRLVSADFMPEGNGEGQAKGTHHIYYRVLDESGNPIVGAAVAQGWPGDQTQSATKPDDGGLGNIAMYGDGKFWPENGESGPYAGWVSQDGLPSDKVNGMGLVSGAHTSYMLTWQLSTYGGEAYAAQASSPDQAAVSMAASQSPEAVQVSNEHNVQQSIVGSDIQYASHSEVYEAGTAPDAIEHPGKIGVVLNAKPGALPSADDLINAGVSNVRISLTVDNCTFPPGASPDPSSPNFDANLKDWQDRLREYHDRGINVVLNFPPEFVEHFPACQRDGNNQIAGIDEGKWEEYKGRYLERLQAVTSLFGDYTDGYEVWNEPDQPERVFFRNDGGTLTRVNSDQGANGIFYDPGLPPKQFGEILNASYEIIKRTDNNQNTVIIGGLDSGQPSYIQNARAANGGVLKFDGVGLHPYTKDTREKLNAIVAQYASVAGKPIYITEATTMSPEHIMTIAQASDDMAAVNSYFFFWNPTSDGHLGLFSGGEGTDRYNAFAQL